jgi:hypothetical protein
MGFNNWWRDKKRYSSGNSKESRKLRKKGWIKDPKGIGSGPRRKHHDMIPRKKRRTPGKKRR